MNDTAKAIAAYENLTKLNPDDTDAQSALAQPLRKARQFRRSEETPCYSVGGGSQER